MSRVLVTFCFCLLFLNFSAAKNQEGSSSELPPETKDLATEQHNLPSSPSLFSMLFSDEWADEFSNNEDHEKMHDIDELEASLGPDVHSRKFVTLSVQRGLSKETSYKFRTTLRRKRDHNHPGGAGKDQLPQETVHELKDHLPPGNYTTQEWFIYYSHAFSVFERAGDSTAKLGDPCQAKTILDADFCERAAYPNKNKMVCNTVKDSRMPYLKNNTCICKFYRISETKHQWKQMKQATLNINGQPVQTCMVPKLGVCNHRIATGHRDKQGNPIYEIDVCQGHFQCDNTKFHGDLLEKKLTVSKHCTESDFLENFDESVRSEILLCAKPNPRRFSDYDEFRYYCLPQKSRDPHLEISENSLHDTEHLI